MYQVLHNRLIVCLLFLVSLGLVGLPHGSIAQTGTTFPSLTYAIASELPSALIRVSGDGFTPGGLVFIALHDQWGETLHETRWVIASSPDYGLYGSMDPAQGFRPGGTVGEVFDLFQETIYGPNGSMDPALGYVPAESAGASCGMALMVRAFDHQAQAWSNTLDVSVGC